MNNNEYNNNNVMPYKASGNLNTAINNPSVNINNTMDVNIKNMTTNNREYNISNVNVNSNPVNNNIDSVSVSSDQVNTNVATNNNIVNNSTNNQINNKNNSSNNKSFVSRTYVTTDNRPKKKNKQINLGSEFKIALLIIVILLVFVFLLPVISDMFGGY